MKLRKLLALPLVLAFVLGIVFAANAATLEVPSTQYPTITAAVAAAKTGDTISVLGSYNSNTAGESFPIVIDGSKVDKITIICQAGATLTVPRSNAGVVFKGVTGGGIENCEITSLPGANADDNSGKITIGDIGVVVKESSGVIVSGNKIHNLLEGIRLYKASSTQLTRNTIYDIGEITNENGNNLLFGKRTGIGIFLEESGTSASDKNTLTKNTVYNAGVAVFYYKSHYNEDTGGIYYENASHGVNLNDSNYNKLTNLTVGGPKCVTKVKTDHDGNGGWGIFLSISDNNTIKGSNIQCNKAGGIELSGAQHNDVNGNNVHDNGTVANGETIQIMVGPGQKAEFTSRVLKPGKAGKPEDPFDKKPNDVRTEIRALKGKLTHLQAKIADLDLEMAGVVSKLEGAIGIVYQMKLDPQTSSKTFQDDVVLLNKKLGEIEAEKDKIFCKIGPLNIDAVDPALRKLIDLQMAKCPKITLLNPPFDKDITAEKKEMIDDIQALKVKIRNLTTAKVIDAALRDALLQKLDTMVGVLLNVDAKLLDIDWKLFVANYFTPTPGEKDAIINNPGDCNNDKKIDSKDIACWLDKWLTKRTPPGSLHFPNLPQSKLPELDLCEIFDTSGSMSGLYAPEVDGFTAALDDVLLPAAAAGAKIKVALVHFGSDVYSILPLTQVNSTNEATIKAGLTTIKSNPDGHSTNMTDALAACESYLSGSTAPRKVIDIATDGYPNVHGPAAAKAKADALGAAGIEIWPLAICTDAGCTNINKPFLDSIAQKGGFRQDVDASNPATAKQNFVTAFTAKTALIVANRSLIDAKLWVEEALKEKEEIPGILCNHTTPPIDSFCEWIAEFNRELPPPPFELNGSGLIGKKEKPAAITVTGNETDAEALISGGEIGAKKDTLATRLTNYTEDTTKLLVKRAQQLGLIGLTDTSIPTSLIDATLSPLRPSSYNIIESNVITMAIRNPNSCSISGPGETMIPHKCNVGLKLISPDNLVINNLIANDVGDIYDQIGKLDIGIILQSDDNVIAYNTIEWIDTGMIRGGDNTRKDIQHEYLFKKLATTVCSPVGDPPVAPCARPLEKMVVLEARDEQITVTNPEARVSGNRISLNFFDHVGIGIEIIDAESNQIDENLFLDNSTGGVVFKKGSNPIHVVVASNDHVHGLSYVNYSGQAVDASQNYALNSPVSPAGSVNPPAATSRFCEANFETSNQKFVTLGTLIQTKFGMSPTIITKFYNSGSPTLPPNTSFLPTKATLPTDKPRVCADVFNVPPPPSTCGDADVLAEIAGYSGDTDKVETDDLLWGANLWLTDGMTPNECTVSTDVLLSAANLWLTDAPISGAAVKSAVTAKPVMASQELSTNSVEPGGSFAATVTLKAQEAVNALAYSLKLPSGWKVTPLDNAGARVKLTSSGAEWIWLEKLAPGETKVLKYTIAVSPTAAEAAYTLAGEAKSASPALEVTVNGRVQVGLVPLAVSSVMAYTSSNAVNFVVEGQGIESLAVQVYNLAGGLVFDSGFVSGNALAWDMLDMSGSPVANGVYLYVVTVRGFNGEIIRTEVRKLVVLR